MTYHVISLVIILQHSTKSTFTYYLILPTSRYTKTHPSIAVKTPYWWGARPLVLPAVIPLQFRSLLTNIPLLGLAFSTSETIRESDYRTKSYNQGRHTKQNQPRMVLVWRTWLLFIKHYVLGTSVTRLRCTARWTQQSMAPWCLFDSSTREAGCIHVALGHSPSEAICEGLGKEEALLNCWVGSWIRGFGDAHSIRVMAKLDGVTHQAKPPERLGGMRKDKTALGRLGQMVWPDGIRLNSSTWWIA